MTARTAHHYQAVPLGRPALGACLGQAACFVATAGNPAMVLDTELVAVLGPDAAPAVELGTVVAVVVPDTATELVPDNVVVVLLGTVAVHTWA